MTYIKPYEEIKDDCHPTTGLYPSGNNQVTGQPQKVNNTYYFNNRTSNKLINVRASATDDSINCCYGDLCTYDSGFVCTSCGSNLRIMQNRDFFIFKPTFDGTAGVGCGTFDSRPATCTAGIGYWATNQSCSSVDSANVGAHPTAPISGTLYKCTATNTWTSYFTPYTYPHPLTITPPLKGDFNADSKVNDMDFTAFKNAFFNAFNSLFDLNSDGVIDVKDLGVLMSSWLP